MSPEQDRVAATRWANDRMELHLKGRWRPRWDRADVKDAYLAGLAASRAQTAELVEALTVIAEFPIPEQDNMVAANMRKTARAALAKVTK